MHIGILSEARMSNSRFHMHTYLLPSRPVLTS